MLCAKNLKVALAAIVGVVVGLASVDTADARIRLNPTAMSDAHEPPYFASEDVAARATHAARNDRTKSMTPVPVMGTSTDGHYGFKVSNIPLLFAHNQAIGIRFEVLSGSGTTAELDDDVVRFNNAKADEIRNATVVIGPTTDGNTMAGQFTEDCVDSEGGGDCLPVFQGFTSDNNAMFWAATIKVSDGSGNEGGNLTYATASYEFQFPLDAISFAVGPTASGAATVKFAVYSSAGAAALGGTASLLWQTSNVVLRAGPVVSARVSAPQEVTAAVASGFRRFTSEPPTKGELATVTVAIADKATINRGTPQQEGPFMVMDSEDGTAIAAEDVLEHVAVKVVTAESSMVTGAEAFNFGEFHVNANCEGAALSRTVPQGTAATADKVPLTMDLTGNIGAGVHKFCANVTANTDEQMRADKDGNMEPYEKYKPISAGISYAMNLNVKYPSITATTEAAAARPAGSITRDGTTVRIGFLTTATNFGADRTVWEGWEGGAYNQRLVITNYGASDAAYELTATPEEGVEVEILEQGMGTIPGGTSVVIPVRNLMTITGGSRTSAILTMAATENNVSVIAAQVTLPEGQTDTVRVWPE